MKHRTAARHLPDFAAGACVPEIKTAVADHLSNCEECARWVETHDLLAKHLQHEVNEERQAHPDNAVLALCAIRPDEIYESDRRDLREHLDSCPPCREEIRMVREALLAARPGHEVAAAPTQQRDLPSPSPPVWARAAIFVGILLGAVVLLISLLSGPGLGDDLPLRADTDATGSVKPTSGHQGAQTLAGKDLDGSRLITADRLVISDLTVKSGADITFRSKGSVAFGSGFRVDSGARIRVDTNEP